MRSCSLQASDRIRAADREYIQQAIDHFEEELLTRT